LELLVEIWIWSSNGTARRWYLGALAVCLGWVCVAFPVLALWADGRALEPVILHPALSLGEKGWSIMGGACIAAFVIAAYVYLENEGGIRVWIWMAATAFGFFLSREGGVVPWAAFSQAGIAIGICAAGAAVWRRI
jgi:hypothetical protein